MKKKTKKIPHSLYASVDYNGIKYGIKLHGRSRKRVIAYYWYVDATGGYLPNLETATIYDQTFESDIEARKMANNFYVVPEELEKIFVKRFGFNHIKTTAEKVKQYLER
ncbi:hypothetical protein [uncultured Enterococcus sp.]|uniref:hypothetical protein n=1 Tax=uncultured Enterococcus sp. TaxID=167972 RepID=UPI0020681C74|nr:hypothetical protein [uncultured Enterococcus sp.]DAL87406.1 MAG TPA: hypothetical protein [Caudoviricetes sp.]